MNGIIKAYEIKPGSHYRLFPSGRRSKYLVAKALGVSEEKRPLFLYTDPDTKMTTMIDSVGFFENVQPV